MSVVEAGSRFQLRYVLAIVFLSLSASYLLYCGVWGNKGWLSLGRQELLLSHLESRLAQKKGSNVRLEARIARLSSDLDQDLLDERVRAVLGFAGSGEIVFLDGPCEKPNKSR